MAIGHCPQPLVVEDVENPLAVEGKTSDDDVESHLAVVETSDEDVEKTSEEDVESRLIVECFT